MLALLTGLLLLSMSELSEPILDRLLGLECLLDLLLDRLLVLECLLDRLLGLERLGASFSKADTVYKTPANGEKRVETHMSNLV